MDLRSHSATASSVSGSPKTDKNNPSFMQEQKDRISLAMPEQLDPSREATGSSSPSSSLGPEKSGGANAEENVEKSANAKENIEKGASATMTEEESTGNMEADNKKDDHAPPSMTHSETLVPSPGTSHSRASRPLAEQGNNGPTKSSPIRQSLVAAESENIPVTIVTASERPQPLSGPDEGNDSKNENETISPMPENLGTNSREPIIPTSNRQVARNPGGNSDISTKKANNSRAKGQVTGRWACRSQTTVSPTPSAHGENKGTDFEGLTATASPTKSASIASEEGSEATGSIHPPVKERAESRSGQVTGRWGHQRPTRTSPSVEDGAPVPPPATSISSAMTTAAKPKATLPPFLNTGRTLRTGKVTARRAADPRLVSEELGTDSRTTVPWPPSFATDVPPTQSGSKNVVGSSPDSQLLREVAVTGVAQATKPMPKPRKRNLRRRFGPKSLSSNNTKVPVVIEADEEEEVKGVSALAEHETHDDNPPSVAQGENQATPEIGVSQSPQSNNPVHIKNTRTRASTSRNCGAASTETGNLDQNSRPIPAILKPSASSASSGSRVKKNRMVNVKIDESEFERLKGDSERLRRWVEGLIEEAKKQQAENGRSRAETGEDTEEEVVVLSGSSEARPVRATRKPISGVEKAPVSRGGAHISSKPQVSISTTAKLPPRVLILGASMSPDPPPVALNPDFRPPLLPGKTNRYDLNHVKLTHSVFMNEEANAIARDRIAMELAWLMASGGGRPVKDSKGKGKQKKVLEQVQNEEEASKKEISDSEEEWLLNEDGSDVVTDEIVEKVPAKRKRGKGHGYVRRKKSEVGRV